MSDLSRAVDRVLVDHAHVWTIALGKGSHVCRCGERFDSVQLWSEHRMEVLAGVFVVTPGSLAAELGLMVVWLWRRLVLRVRPPVGVPVALDELLTPAVPATADLDRMPTEHETLVVLAARDAGFGRTVAPPTCEHGRTDAHPVDPTMAQIFWHERPPSCAGPVATPTGLADAEVAPVEDWPASCPACGALAPNLRVVGAPPCGHWFHSPLAEQGGQR